jgi:hypothetical protein
MTAIQYLDQPPAGWFVLDVMRQEDRGREWVVLMVDIHPDEPKNCICDFPALFYVNPKDYRAGGAGEFFNVGFALPVSTGVGTLPGTPWKI